MRVLIADRLSDGAASALESLGMEVKVSPELKSEDLATAISDSDILIVRSTRVTAQTVEKASKLSLIIRAGAGVNTIDVEAANARGIYVSNCPGRNTDAVAELAIGLLISADRQIVNAATDLRKSLWKKKEYGKARGLKGRTLGIIGFGSIGKAVAKRARCLEMEVAAWSRSLTPEKANEFGVEYSPDIISLAHHSDAISIHVAYNSQTRHLINLPFLDAMKDGAILINTSRGEIVDTPALKEAIKKKKLRVGMDVFEHEPQTAEGQFGDQQLANVVTATPHIGASTDQASEAIADEVIRIVKYFQETGVALNAVNIRRRSSATKSLIIRHHNRVGVIARVLNDLRNSYINVEEMTNTVFESSNTACCTLLLDSSPPAEILDGISRAKDIIAVTMKPSLQSRRDASLA